MRTITSGPVTAVGIRPDAAADGRYWARSTDSHNLTVWDYGDTEAEACAAVAAHLLRDKGTDLSIPTGSLISLLVTK